MASRIDRKARVRQYKETARPAGVYRVRNTAKRKSLVGSTVDLAGMLNRLRFQLENGSHPDRELQSDWNESGPNAFEFEVLDRLEPKAERDYDPIEDLRVLKEMWLHKLAESGELLYGGSRRGA
jgi:hypothetical protein